MTWVAWRLQRTETLVAAAILAAIAVVLVPTGLEMLSAFHHDGLGACVSTNPSAACAHAIGEFQQRFGGWSNIMSSLTLIPGVVGVLLAAPFLLELENGTYRLAWTQSITRRRWIVTKLAVPVTAALLLTGVYILLMTWWRSPFEQIGGRMDTGTYDSEGTVALGYALFAFGLAVAVGVLWRRAVPAIMVAFAAYVAARVFVDTWLRNRLVAPLHATWAGNQSPPPGMNNADVISQRASGGTVTISGGGFAPIAAHGQIVSIRRHGDFTMHAVYQPESHFWALQGTETALFVGVALVLILFAGWWTHRRTA